MDHNDPLYNLADALSEDILAAPDEMLVAEAAQDDQDSAAAFDRIAARALARSRRQRIIERLRALAMGLGPSLTWTSAMAGIAGVFVMGIVGGLYLRPQMTAAPPPPTVVADRMPANYATVRANPENRPASFGEDRAASLDHAAAVQPAPAAAPPAVALAPPPAPGAAAGVADEPRRVRTTRIQPEPSGDDAAAASRAAPPAQPAPPAPPPIATADARQASTEYQRALALAEQEQSARTLSPSVPAIAAAPAAPAKRSAARARLASTQDDVAPSFDWPVRGRVIAGYGSPVGGVPNNGIDLAVPAGTDIRAADEGVVAYAGELAGFGKLILLRHRDGFITAYAHAQSFAVKVGDTVARGQVIAKSGQTGTADAPRVHFEIRRGSTAVDPAPYLSAR